MDAIKFQVTWNILFYILAASLELAFFLWNTSKSVITDIELWFPLDYFLALPLTCIDCISLWSVYSGCFVFVMLIIRKWNQRNYGSMDKGQVDSKMGLLNGTASSTELEALLPGTPPPSNKKQD